MLIYKRIRQAILCLATAGLLIPTQCFGQAPVAPEQKVSAVEQFTAPAKHNAQPVDIALDGDVLRGHVADSAGQPVPFANVMLFQNQQLVASGLSNGEGQFAIAKIRGGIYQIASGERIALLRCWTGGTAPPSARQSTLLQVTDVQRAQISPATCSLANPWIIAGVAIAAIVIPMAIHSNRDDRDAGS